MATKQEDEAPTSGSLHPEAEDHMLKMLIIDECFSTSFPTKIQEWDEADDEPFGDEPEPTDMQ